MSYILNNLSETDAELVSTGKKLPVMEEFFTIQGEGFNTGKAAYFIRIGGCDIGCHWCDVKESWDANTHPLIDSDEVVNRVKLSGADSVVITGGEPLLYNLDYITETLHANHIHTFIETSGAYDASGKWDWFCLSPKKNQTPLKENYLKADELKVIVFNKHDLIWAEEQASQVSAGCHLFLQPEWSKISAVLPLIIDYVKANPKWRISLQTHKYMNIP